MNPLIALAVQELPGLISYLKLMFAKQNPTAPMPSDMEIIAAYQVALADSLTVDADWLTKHPPQP